MGMFDIEFSALI